MELAILILNAGMAREKGNFSYSKIWWYWCADTGKSQTWCNVWPQIRTMASYSGLSPASLPANNNNNQRADQPRHSSSRVNTAFCACVCKWNICLFLSYLVKCGTMLLFVFTNSADHKSKFHLCHQHTGQSGHLDWYLYSLSHWKGNNMKHEIKGLAQVLNSILSIGF